MSGARQLAGFARRAVQTKTSAYLVKKSDVASVLLVSGGWTLSLPAAASLGGGFPITIRNYGTGKITLDPNGAELVNGLATLGIYPGDCVELICDGTAWHALFQSVYSKVVSATTMANLTALDILLPESEFTSFEVEIDGCEPTIVNALGLRVSNDNGATYANGGTAYAWSGSYDSQSTSNAITYKSSGGSIFAGTGIELTPGAQGVAAGQASLFRLKVVPRGVGRFAPITWETQIASVAYRGVGYLGNSSLPINGLRFQYAGSGLIATGAHYSVVGKRS